MGAAGRVPEPSWLKKLKGNPGRRPISAAEPKPHIVKWMEPPPHFDADETKLWHALCKELSRMEILSTTDQYALERYVVFLHKWRQCRVIIRERYNDQFSHQVRGPGVPAHVAQNGTIITPAVPGTVKFLKPFPEIRLLIDLSSHLNKIEDRFGLSPSARSRIMNEDPTNPDGNDGDSDFADLEN